MKRTQVGPDINVFEVEEDCGCIYITRELSPTKEYPGFFQEVRLLKQERGVPMECKMHRELRIQEALDREEREQSQFDHATELQCDRCGEHMGFVSSNDLEGSQFYCDKCKL